MKPITDKLVLECFYNFQREVLNGDGLYCRKPYQRLMKRTKTAKAICLQACLDVASRGLLNLPDKNTTLITLARADGLITTKGRKVLGVPNKEFMLRSCKPKGPDLLVQGWKWK